MAERPGYVEGRHFSEYVDRVRRLRRRHREDQAIALLLRLVAATEAEAKASGGGVAPWYYWQLAVAYRKLGRRRDEIRILERFSRQKHAPGARPPKLMARLAKLRTVSSP